VVPFVSHQCQAGILFLPESYSWIANTSSLQGTRSFLQGEWTAILPDRGLPSIPCIYRNSGCISMVVDESDQDADL
jgi:hypothetical protein